MSSKIRDQYNGIVEEMYFSQIEATLKERKLAVTPYKLWKAVASSDPHELLKRLSKRENDAEPIK